MDLKNLLKNRHNGFTLIELTVALLIISLIMGLVLPKIGNALYSRDLKHSVRRLRAVLSAARSLATSDRIPRRIVCDIPKGDIRIEREIRDEGEGLVTVHYEKENSTLIRTFTFPKGVKIEDVITESGEKALDGEAYLRIGSNGMIHGNRIHLTDGEKQYTLVINVLTGGVIIEQGYTEEYKVDVPQG